MANPPKTPGVYVVEQATLPPSVAEVATAIPAFIGYTEKLPPEAEENHPFVKRIDTLLEYETLFGLAKNSNFVVTYYFNSTTNLTELKVEGDSQVPPLLYYSLSLYFKNGGGSCYIVSIGDHDSALEPTQFSKGLTRLATEDEPTLILMPDAVKLGQSYYPLCDEALAQCETLKDRFCIFDVLDGTDAAAQVAEFRDKTGINNLRYGAAYHPYLRTSLTYQYDEKEVKVNPKDQVAFQKMFGDKGIAIRYTGTPGDAPKSIIKAGPSTSFEIKPRVLTIVTAESNGSTIASEWTKWTGAGNDAKGFAVIAANGGTDKVSPTGADPVALDELVTFQKTFGGITLQYSGAPNSAPSAKIQTGQSVTFSITGTELTIGIASGSTAKTLADEWKNWVATPNEAKGFAVIQVGDDGATVTPTQGNDAVKLDQQITFQKTFGAKGITIQYTGGADEAPTAKIQTGQNVTFAISGKELAITIPTKSTGKTIADEWKNWVATPNEAKGFAVIQVGNGSGIIEPTPGTASVALPPLTLDSIKSLDTALYNQIKTRLAQEYVTLPPSPAIAGIYASVDRTRGVWKAPANVSVTSVTEPRFKITNDEQDLLNVDPTSGKSINAIRAFTGKGTLVWGARTLAGNDNEWRYINVRRLFNVIEESIQKATAFAVFESNDATTWLKVKAMIESYLFGLWERGALFGSTPAAAYFVNVGLGKTMTAQDILEGRMNVKVGVAAVRPAEFIILTFTHKLPTA